MALQLICNLQKLVRFQYPAPFNSMNEVLSKALHTLYPNIYGNNRYSTDKELGSPVLHFELEDGWFTLLNYLGNFLDDQHEPGLHVLQAKEKFGSLTVYTSNCSDIVNDELYRVRKISETICEYCGLPGSLRQDLVWIKTLCDKCNETY